MSFNKAWEEPGKTSARPWPWRPGWGIIWQWLWLESETSKTSGK